MIRWLKRCYVRVLRLVVVRCPDCAGRGWRGVFSYMWGRGAVECRFCHGVGRVTLADIRRLNVFYRWLDTVCIDA